MNVFGQPGRDRAGTRTGRNRGSGATRRPREWSGTSSVPAPTALPSPTLRHDPYFDDGTLAGRHGSRRELATCGLSHEAPPAPPSPEQVRGGPVRRQLKLGQKKPIEIQLGNMDRVSTFCKFCERNVPEDQRELMAKIIDAWATEDVAYTNETEAWGAMEHAMAHWNQQKWLHGLPWEGHMKGAKPNATMEEAEELARAGGPPAGVIDIFSARPADQAKWVVEQFPADKVKFIGVDPWTWGRIDASKEAVSAHFGDFSATRLHVSQKGENSYVVALRLPAAAVFTVQNKVTMAAQTPVGKQKGLPVATGETNNAEPVGAKNESGFSSLYVGGRENWGKVAGRAIEVYVMSPTRNPSSLPQ